MIRLTYIVESSKNFDIHSKNIAEHIEFSCRFKVNFAFTLFGICAILSLMYLVFIIFNFKFYKDIAVFYNYEYSIINSC